MSPEQFESEDLSSIFTIIFQLTMRCLDPQPEARPTINWISIIIGQVLMYFREKWAVYTLIYIFFSLFTFLLNHLFYKKKQIKWGLKTIISLSLITSTAFFWLFVFIIRCVSESELGSFLVRFGKRSFWWFSGSLKNCEWNYQTDYNIANEFL